MMNEPHRALGLPSGTERLHIAESARHTRIAGTLAAVWDRWGYDPVETPLVDYLDVYRTLVPTGDLRATYRVVDRQGDVLVVRPDTTLFLAKQLGVHLAPDDLPLRIRYDDQIVREEPEHDIASREYQQAGIELVGVPGDEGDLEALLVLIDTLAELDVRGPVLHIGSHALAVAAADGGDPERTAAAARHARAAGSDRSPIDELLTTIAPPDRWVEAVRRLTAMGLPCAVAEEAERIGEVGRRLTQLDRRIDVRIDGSERGSHPYYSGIAFGVYVAHATSAVARGGRYDRLLARFGFDVPAVGFSIYPRKLPATTAAGSATAPHRAAGASIDDRLVTLRRHHERGERCTL